MSTHNLKPLSEVIKDLKNRGLTADFIYKDEKLYATDKDKHYDAEEITIKEEYRFEGDSDPADMSILYAVEASDGTKGTLVDTYGVDSNVELEEFLEKAHYEAQK